MQAITRRDPEEPKLDRRKRRDGDKGGQVAQFPRAKPTKPGVPRGRYGALKVAGKTKGRKAARSFKRAANDATADEGAMAEAIAYLSDTLDWMNPYWPPDTTNTMTEIDEGFAAPQAWHHPKL
jgi:hypothetical protein